MKKQCQMSRSHDISDTFCFRKVAEALSKLLGTNAKVVSAYFSRLFGISLERHTKIDNKFHMCIR